MLTLTRTPGAVLYARVSTGEQAQHGTSLDTQKDACRAKALSLSLPIVAEYEDPGVSGGFLLSRPGIQAALALIQQGEADTLICANLSRFSRDVEHQQTLMKAVRQAGGRLLFCDVDFADTPEGDMMFNFMGGYAQYERHVIRDRSMKGKRRRAEDGQQPARCTSPYGYHIVTKADVIRGEYPAAQLGRYIVVEDRATLVRELFTRYISRAESLSDLCRDLNGRGLPPPGVGRCWHPSVLSLIFSNPVYKGQAVYGRRIHQRDERRLQMENPRTGGYMITPEYERAAPPEAWVLIDCPALVSESLWNGVQETLQTRSHHGGSPKRVRMLSGRIFCAECGERMALTSTPRRTYKKDGVYYCGVQQQRSRKQIEENTRPAPCSPLGHKRPTVEGAVVQAIQHALHCPRVVQEAVQASVRRQQRAGRGGQDTKAELAALTRALDTLKEEEARTVQAQIAGMQAGASPDAYAFLFADLAARRKDLENRRGLLMRQSQEAAPAPKGEGILPRLLQEVERVLLSPDVSDERKRAIIGTVIERVACYGPEGAYPGGVEVGFLPEALTEVLSEEGTLIVQPVITGWTERIPSVESLAEKEPLPVPPRNGEGV